MSHHLHCSLSQLQQRNEPKSILCAPACLLFLQHSSHVYAQTGLFYSITSHSRNKPPSMYRPFLTRLSLDCSIHWSFHHSKDLRHVQGKILNNFFFNWSTWTQVRLFYFYFSMDNLANIDNGKNMLGEEQHFFTLKKLYLLTKNWTRKYYFSGGRYLFNTILRGCQKSFP